MKAVLNINRTLMKTYMFARTSLPLVTVTSFMSQIRTHLRNKMVKIFTSIFRPKWVITHFAPRAYSK